MKYCDKCLCPNTRPGIVLNEDNICTGCNGQIFKDEKINWNEMEKKFLNICNEAREKAINYDCIIPASGGKDSWYAIIKCKEYGLKPLVFTYRTPGRTAIGQENVDLMIKNLSVDHIDFTVSTELEKKFMKKSFEVKGDPGLPFHMAVYVMPYKFAKLMKIPLIVWGENPQLEFGGSKDEQLKTEINDDWMSKFGCMQGTDADYWIDQGISSYEIDPFKLNQFPNNTNDFTVSRIFLGAFFKWNSFENAKIARDYGFISGDKYKKTGHWNFADLDCNFISLHHFPMLYKFGTLRALDNLSVQIRYGLITKKDAISTFEKQGLIIPHDDIKSFCEFVKEDISWFWKTLENFRNNQIWSKKNDVWYIPNFIIKQFDWEYLNKYAYN